GLQRVRILLERDQSIRHVLERGEHRAAILLSALLIGVARRALLVQLGSAVEDRREKRRANVPEAGSRAEDLADGERIASRVGAERDVRKAVRTRHSDLRARGVHILLRL